MSEDVLLDRSIPALTRCKMDDDRGSSAYVHIDPIDVPAYQSLFHLKPHQIPSYLFNGALVVNESTPEVEDMLSGLFDGMQPKLITLPPDVSMEQYYEAKALVARCEAVK